jgi:UDP-N-acetylglucosamine--N-acetylmuramyl-(pentapeptide) pyrophosphoryl-undecaprenol N-acetylglucosamine transferase
MPADGAIHIAFCGGGSGGHIVPGLAVATHVQAKAPSATFQFITSGREIDAKIFDSSDIAARGAAILALPLLRQKHRFQTVWDVLRSIVICLRQFRTNRPCVVFGSGGLASVPGVLAAYWLGIPVGLIEQNAVPGKANCFLNRFADMTFVGWSMEPRFRMTWKSAIRDVGIPLRQEFCSGCDVSVEPPSSQPTILVLGGSQGADSLNRLVVDAFGLDKELLRHCRVMHQAGVANVMAVKDLYLKLSMRAEVVPFFDPLSAQLQFADIVISRAGAVSLAEIAAFGRASILVPLPSSADGHQLANAKIPQNAGAAKMIDQNNESAANDLLAALRELILSPQLRQSFGAKARDLVRLDAAEKIAEWVLEGCGTP